jgi:hypothetical protein
MTTSELADDLDSSIATLADRLNLREMEGDNPVGISPAQGLAMLRPMLATKATSDRELTLRALAVIHMETGALLDKHTEESPEEIA